MDFRQKFAEIFNDAEQLDRLADEFANNVPEDKFTPAEIQGFLLGNMEEPLQAVAKVIDWVAEMTGQKEGGIKKTAEDAFSSKRKANVRKIDPTGPYDPAVHRLYSPKGRPSSSEDRKKQSDFTKEYMQRVSQVRALGEEEEEEFLDDDTVQKLTFDSGANLDSINEEVRGVGDGKESTKRSSKPSSDSAGDPPKSNEGHTVVESIEEVDNDRPKADATVAVAVAVERDRATELDPKAEQKKSRRRKRAAKEAARKAQLEKEMPAEETVESSPPNNQ